MSHPMEQSRKVDRPAVGPLWSYGPEVAQLVDVN
jgi:hypothetical protein